MADKIAPYWPLQDPFDSHIVLVDGTEIDGEGGLSDIDNALWLWPNNLTIAEAAVLFSDNSKTSTIAIRKNDSTAFYEGYTKLTDIKTNWSGKLSVCMKQP